MVKGHDAARAGELLHELDALGVVLALDLRVVRERRVLLRAAEVLEARRIERDGVLLPANVLNLHLVRLAHPVLAALARRRVRVNVDVRLLAVRGRREVDELGGHCVGDRHGSRVCGGGGVERSGGRVCRGCAEGSAVRAQVLYRALHSLRCNCVLVPSHARLTERSADKCTRSSLIRGATPYVRRQPQVLSRY